MTARALPIRLAEAPDAVGLARCVTSAFGHYIARIGRPPRPMLADFDALIRERRAWVAVDGDMVAGALVIEPQHADGFYIDTLAVAPSHQGTGLGRALLQFAEDMARRSGHGFVHLATNGKMTENQRLYPYLGYVETGRGHSEGYERVFYRKTFAAS